MRCMILMLSNCFLNRILLDLFKSHDAVDPCEFATLVDLHLRCFW